MRSNQQDGEINRLRRELIHARTQINDIQEELEEKATMYTNLLQERNQLKEQWQNTKESISRVETIVQSKVDMAMQRERAELAKFREENTLLKQRQEILDQSQEQMHEEKKQLIDKVQGLTQDLAFYARNVEARDAMKRIELLREERDQKDRIIVEHLKNINDCNNHIEDLIAENRILRKMANVPDNFGKDLVQIKLHDREKIEDYKKLIQVLQDDNYQLEEQRAKLKHQLKQQSMMYKQEPSQRYKGLSQEQIFKVDQYVMRLLSGDSEDPADFYKLKKENQHLKAQLEALNSKGFDFVKNQIEVFFKDKGGFGDSSKQLDKISSSNDELMRLIKQLLTNGVPTTGGHATTQQTSYAQQTGKFRPPVPHPEFDGQINSGYSYKFDTHLDVVGKDGRPGLGDATRYDAACLQLSLLECLELIRRKDDNLNTNQNIIDSLYRRVRDYLLTQDQLYKDYVSQEKDFNTKKVTLEQTLRNVRDTLGEEQMKVGKLENLIKTLQKGDKQSIEARIIELTKQNAILDVNLLRLTRKYQTLEEQELLLRREYHNKEADMAEKDRFVQDRINKLKEWKAKAIQQLNYLFQKLKCAVPLTEYQSVQSELDLTKQKNADLIDRNSKMALKMSKLQTQLRENMEFEERYRNLQELKDEAENELEIIKKRLEQVDSNYRWENAIFQKIVQTLKRVKVSPQQAFEEFDVNKDGKLKREEFQRALELLKVSDLSNQEIDILMNSLDSSGDGVVSYSEFVHKLSRYGIRSRSTEEQIIYLIIEALKKSKIKNLSEAFSLIDKEQRGFISKEDFKDIFKNLSIKLDSNDLDKFIDQFWKDKSAGIDYQQFLRIFKRYQIRLEEEENSKQGQYIKIPEEIIRLKKTLFNEMNKAFIKEGKSIEGFFKRVDVDQSDKIDLVEFKAMFEKMKLKLTHTQSEQIFNSIDFDYSGDISFPEFISDFKHIVVTDLDKLILEEKEKAMEAVRGDSRQSTNERQGSNQAYNNEDIMRGLGAPGKQNVELQYQTRIAIFEAREKQSARKLETAMKILKYTENAKNEASDSYNILEKKWNEMTESYHVMKSEIVELQEERRQSINKTEAEKIKRFNEKLQTELVETKAAMLSYKSMTDVIADQTKGLKLMIERKKDENENLFNALRELQSQSVDQQRLGKLYYVVMLSRWQEAAVNKKYDMTLTENKQLRMEILNQEQIDSNKDDKLHESENTLQQRTLIIEKLRQQLSSTKNMFLTLDKAQEFNNIIQDISDEKTELEEHYFSLRSEFISTQIRMDEATSKFEHVNELLQILEYKKQSELSDKVIELSQKIQNSRLNEMKATREHEEIKEKITYVNRLLKQKVDSVKKLEEQVSEFESKLHKREEEFRRADNERMRRFFNAKYDNIGGAMEQDGATSSRKTVVFQDSLADYNSGNQQQHSSSLGMGRDMSMAPPSYIQDLNRNKTGGNNGGSGSNQVIDMKMLEGQIKRLKEELKNAVDQIKAKDSIINRFKEWQLADKYLSQDAELKDAIDHHRTKTSEIHEQESKEMAEAAYVTIKTLQEMLDQKNEQLRSKEELIIKINKQAANQREQDQNEIARLYQQNSLAGDTALSKLQEIVSKNEANKGNKGPQHSLKYERMTREELQRVVQEKDHKIQELAANTAGLNAQLEELYQSKKSLIVQNQQLEQNVWQEKQNNQLKGKVAELEEIKKKIRQEQQQNEKLTKTILELNAVMQKITKENVETTEDLKMGKIQENTKINELMKQVQELQNRIKLQDINTKKAKEELKNLKIKDQEKEDKEKKLIQERDDAFKGLKNTRETVEAEIKKRQSLQIEVDNYRERSRIGGDIKSGVTLESLQNINRELQNDVLILQCQQKTVVVYNKESATFEYVGEPILLNYERELTDLEEIIEAIKKWLQKNERLTIKSIFEAMDKENFGELTTVKFDLALSKIGIKLRDQERNALKQVLDPKNLGYFKYRPLIREISGIPQLEFLPIEVIKLAKLVEFRDLDRTMFYSLIDPQRYETMTLQQLHDTLALVKTPNFEMKPAENEAVFKYVTKSLKTTGVSMSVSKLGERVFVAEQALLLEKLRDSLFKSMKSLSDLFSKHDSNRDGFLDYSETENLFLECQLAFKPNMLKEIFSILDPAHRFSKVSYQTLKFYLSDNTSQLLGGVISRSIDLEPSQDRFSQCEETTSEELQVCRMAARKILSACQNNLPDLLSKKDIHNEGLIGREDVQRILEDLKIKDLSLGELNLILKYADKGHKGYICSSFFLDKLSDLAIETKQDTMLRRFATTIKHQGIDIRGEMSKYEQNGKNLKLDKKTFFKAMKQLSIALTDEEIELLYQSSEIPEQKGYMEIRTFVAKVNQAAKSKPLPTFIAQPPKILSASSKVNSKAGGQQSGVFENWEVEKKYKKKLEALQQQIEESKKETQAVEKQSKHWQDMANRLEKEKNALQTRFVDMNAKPPKAAMYESLNQGQLEQMQGLKDQIFYLQEENHKLERTIQVELKAELGNVIRQKENLEEKQRNFSDENKRLEHQVTRLIGKPMDQLEQREEGEFWREKRILELEKQLEHKDQQEQEANDQLFKTEEKVLDLKFQNETYELQYARLQKRITDLEQYKLASSKYSAVIQKQGDNENKRIEEVASASSGFGQSKKNQETVKLRSKATTSVAELEMVIESLKRVIEKQKTENENLQRQLDQHEKKNDKLRSEKTLRQKIENLEQEVHSHEMKDINVEEKDRTIKKLLESNKIMREDLKREDERYALLEKKYKDLLIKYNVLCKDHASHVEKLFSMGTGTNIHNYDNFLSQNEVDLNRQEKNPWSNKNSNIGKSKAKDASFDRQFEDVY